MRMPVQARSAYTVEVIFEATIHVLVQLGISQLTTTKVANRAGVSVGTLYQYFPNKAALLSATLERHLRAVVVAVETSCSAAKGQPIQVMVTSVVNAFVEAKLGTPDASKALYAVASELGGDAAAQRMTERSRLALSVMLATAADATFGDLRVVSYMLTTALIGPVQGLLHPSVPSRFVHQVKENLALMALAYLQQVAIARKVTN